MSSCRIFCSSSGKIRYNLYYENFIENVDGAFTGTFLLILFQEVVIDDHLLHALTTCSPVVSSDVSHRGGTKLRAQCKSHVNLLSVGNQYAGSFLRFEHSKIVVCLLNS